MRSARNQQTIHDGRCERNCAEMPHFNKRYSDFESLLRAEPSREHGMQKRALNQEAARCE
jgi:hypothetical protein